MAVHKIVSFSAHNCQFQYSTHYAVKGCRLPIHNGLNIPTLNMTMFDCIPNNVVVGKSVIKNYYGKKLFCNR
jgi:hypothetical protein